MEAVEEANHRSPAARGHRSERESAPIVRSDLSGWKHVVVDRAVVKW